MPFAQYTDGSATISAIRWDGTEEVSAEVIYQIPGVSVHANTIGDQIIKELRFGSFLTIAEGEWLVISVAGASISAMRMTDAAFNQSFTLVP